MYLLDTDILVNILRSKPPLSILSRLKGLKRSEQYTTTLNVGDLMYIVYMSNDPPYYENLLHRLLLSHLEILPFDTDASKRYGSIKADLEKKGISLSDRSIRIAAICLCHNLTLVTSRTEGLKHINGLKVENWLD
jgi:predicted nucleic acid-binding protein